MAEFLAISATCAAVIAAVLLVTFVVGERLARHNVVDVAWGLAFTAVALTAALMGDGDGRRRWLLALLISVWGLRLAGYLAIRSRGQGEDPRYVQLLAKSRRSRVIAVLVRVYLLQGILIWLISLPVQLAATLPGGLSGWALAGLWTGLGAWLLGFTFEAVGDAQLRAFKRLPDSRGELMTTGLWRYTRHPNYFGDACVWWGLYLICLTGGPIVLTMLLSPIIMTVLLVRVSGKALLERHMANRPGYDEYIRRTSGFFPRPPRTT